MPRSLHVRLVLIPSAILLLGLAVSVAFAFVGARARVQAEVGSSLRLGRILLNAELAQVAGASDPDQAFQRLATELPRIRHIRFAVFSAAGQSIQDSAVRPKPDADRPPVWFAALFDPPSSIESIPARSADRTLGRIDMTSHPQDEIGEIWNELTYQTVLLLSIGAVTAALTFLTVRLALRPLRELAAGFDRLEHGDFDAAVGPISVTELRRIGEQFDRLVRSLRRVTDDNHLLIDRLISLQEAERKEIAHELHDEFGPSLFGIRADVACILRASQQQPADLDEIRERATSVSDLADGIQRINYRMLDRLRPLVLDQMGLDEALQQLVDGWRDRYPSIDWTLQIDCDVEISDEPTRLTLFRFVQECLTNIARHAGATAAHVCVDCASTNAGWDGCIHVAIADNGRGFPPDWHFGFGLLGMTERVRALRGRLRVSGADRSSGAVIEVWTPITVSEQTKAKVVA